MARLLTMCETYRVDTDYDANEFINQVKRDADENDYELTSYARAFKQKKSKGEVIDECYIVKLNKTYGKVWDEVE